MTEKLNEDRAGRLRTRIAGTADRFERRTGARQRRERALHAMKGGDASASIALQIEEPTRIATRAVGAGIATSTGEVLAGRGLTPAVALERIIGSTNLQPSRFLDNGARRGAAVGRVVLRTPGGASAGFGTGFLVAPHVIMTNNHVLADAQTAGASLIQFAYLEGRDGQINPIPVGLRPDRLFVTDQALDFTLVATEPSAGDGSSVAARGWIPLLGPSGKALVGEQVNIIQHPLGQPQQIAIHDNPVVDVFDTFLHYETDTERGSSGSPVFNNDWELAALHHSGVPRRDASGNILLATEAVWDGNPATANLISWVANEGVRVSAIVAHLRQILDDGDLPDPTPLQAILSAVETTEEVMPTSSFAGAPVSVTGPLVRDGRATWDLRLTVDLPGHTQDGNGPDQPPDLSDREYYDPEADGAAAEAYYAEIAPENEDLFDQLAQLVDASHTTRLTYREARLEHLYPLVDLHPDRRLRSVYSDADLDPNEVIAAEMAAENARQRLLRAFTSAKGFDPAELGTFLARLEADHQFNCEHVVPQSWFDAKEPMRSDLHHLFTCDPGCNSFRSNIPYWDFPEDDEAVRDECGQSAEGLKFEPDANHGAVARATLYFLIRYPGQVGDTPKELPADRLDILRNWHTARAPTLWEQHRNAEIAAIQGNRNPLIDHPDWAEQIDFGRGFASLP